METMIREWLAQSGIGDDVEISSMTSGLGHTTMWKISGAGTDGDLVLRMFPPHDTVFPDREALAMRTVSERGLPVPTVVTTGTIEDRPVLLMTLAPGETVAGSLEPRPGDDFDLGVRLGTLLAEVNRIPAPAELAPDGRWIERAGPALAPLHDRLRGLPDTNRLLHLDYHPDNVLMDGGEVTGIIDWTNTLPGPPHIDLGRSRAILQMVRSLPTLTPEAAAAVERFEAGLVAGHETVHGPDPEPNLTLAWGFGMICVDFVPQVEGPEGWLTAELVRQLEERRDALIDGAST